MADSCSQSSGARVPPAEAAISSPPLLCGLLAEGEVRVLQRGPGSDAFRGVVLEQPRQQVNAEWLQRGHY